MARDALEGSINVKVRGTWRKMTVRKAAYLRLGERAVAGDAKALDFLLLLESEERTSGPDNGQTHPLSAKDFKLLQSFFDRRRTNVSPSAQPPNARQQQRLETEKDKK